MEWLSNIDWPFWGSFMSAVGIPILGLVLVVIERRAKKKEEAQKRFHELSIDGWEKTGNVVVANANIALDGQSEALCRELKTALKEYNSFRNDVNAFKRDKTVGTLRN